MCVFAVGEEAVPTKKSKMIVSTSQMVTSQARVQRVRHTKITWVCSKKFHWVIWLNSINENWNPENLELN